jgi:hypothetical protein
MSRWFDEEKATEPLTPSSPSPSIPAKQQAEAEKALDALLKDYNNEADRIQHGSFEWPSET